MSVLKARYTEINVVWIQLHLQNAGPQRRQAPISTDRQSFQSNWSEFLSKKGGTRAKNRRTRCGRGRMAPREAKLFTSLLRFSRARLGIQYITTSIFGGSISRLYDPHFSRLHEHHLGHIHANVLNLVRITWCIWWNSVSCGQDRNIQIQRRVYL